MTTKSRLQEEWLLQKLAEIQASAAVLLETNLPKAGKQSVRRFLHKLRDIEKERRRDLKKGRKR
jgi:hypothetical protein